jgi:hypothetical protein
MKPNRISKAGFKKIFLLKELLVFIRLPSYTPLGDGG